MFKLEFSTDNAAFDVVPHDEIARILRAVADDVEGWTLQAAGERRTIRDANGNRIGSWSYEPSESGEGRAHG